MNLPSWYEFLLLSLAAWRVYRLIAEDTILDPIRNRVLRLDPNWEKEGDDPGDDYRMKWGIFLTCAFCAGFWVSGIALALYCLVVEWIGVFSFLVCWFAISAVVAIVAKNLDPAEQE